MLGVGAEKDLVILHLTRRRSDVLLRCADAEALVRELRAQAVIAEISEPTLMRGEPWSVKVVSYDGMVGLRFFPPHAGAPERVPLPPAVARALADDVEFKSQQARHKMRFVFKGN